MAHSLSPCLHAAAAAWADRTVEYPLLRTDLDALPTRLAALQRAGHRGVNLTAPLKVAVRAHLHGESAAAGRLGAVNTVLFGADGRRWGDNTDLAGFRWQLSAHPIPPGDVVVLGAGGAARAVLAALQDTDATQAAGAAGLVGRVTLLARRLEAAEALARCLNAPVAVARIDALAARLPGAGLVISCLPASAAPALAALDWARADPGLRFIDLGYAPASRALVQQVRSTGRRAEDGLAMLAAQGVAAFARFTGIEVPLASVWHALTAAVRAGDPRGALEGGDPEASPGIAPGVAPGDRPR